MQRDALLEAILFYAGEAMSVTALAKTLSCTEGDVREAAAILKERLVHGVSLVEHDNELQLATASGASEIIRALRHDELSRDLGKAATETLAIIAYRGPINKSRIDVIRGVNSGAILRSLLMRGLIEKKNDTEATRGYLYSPSLELLQYLGITRASDLPDFEAMNQRVSAYLSTESDDTTDEL